MSAEMNAAMKADCDKWKARHNVMGEDGFLRRLWNDAYEAAWNRRAPLPAEQPSNPVPRMGGNTKELTDEQVIEIAQDMAISRYSDRDDILMFAEALRRARIVGQQTKGGGK